MLKKILIFIILIISQIFVGNNIFAAQIPVEKVFSDIDKTFPYYTELQTLYDRGMIYPDENGKFNPKKLLNRDEFVGISMEVTCKRCISPNTNFKLLKDHSQTQTFYDVPKNNKYFYCIAESDKLGYVKGYDKGYRCENKTEKREEERPFCIDNKITLDEAIAVLLRNSGIFNVEDNKKVLSRIYSGEITENLADDVSPKNKLGQVYTFYGYLQKALNFELKEIDKNGNEKIYKLLEKQNNKIYPYKLISKEEFLRIAYIALKSNSCIQEEENNLAIGIKITDINNPEFGFKSIVFGQCTKGIDDEKYIWKFFNINNGDEINKTGKNIDSYRFLSEGKWRIILEIEDNCGNKSKSFSTIDINNNGLDVQIEADPMIGNKELNVQFNGIVTGGTGKYTYRWNFKNGSFGYIKEPENLFKLPGTYNVTLIVTDENGNTGEATVTIKVLDFDSCDIDADGDGIMDCDDNCPTVKGDIKNNGCPIFEEKCGTGCSCGNGYECTVNNPKTCEEDGVCVPKKITLNKCLEKGYNSFIYGNTVCNTCPCKYKLDFLATLRKCDLVFPAITSPDSKKIFSKGNNYQIQ